MRRLTHRANLLLASFAVFSAAVLSLSLTASTFRVAKIEKDVYGAYVESMLEDGDLNIFDQVPEEGMRWLVTATGNHPDIRPNGHVPLWLPFYGYGSLLRKLGFAEAHGKLRMADPAQTFATLFTALFSLALGLQWIGWKANRRRALGLAALLTLGTPLVWYGWIETSGNDVASAFFLTVTAVLCANFLHAEASAKHWALFGAFLALSVTAKPVALFHAGLLALLYRAGSARIGAALAGFGAVIALYLGNLLVKYGFAGSPYLAHLRHSFFSPLEFLFGPSGHIFVSPLYALALAGAVFMIRRGFGAQPAIASVNRALLAILAVNLVAWAYRPFGIGEELFGGRYLLAQQLVFLAGLDLLFRTARSRRARAGAIVAAGLAVAWNLFMASRYFVLNPDWGIAHGLSRADFFRIGPSLFAEIRNALAELPGVLAWTIPWAPVSVAIAAAVGSVLRWERAIDPRALRTLSRAAFVLVAGYAMITAMNVLNNRANARELAGAGRFSRSVVGNGMALFIYDDILSVLPKVLARADADGNAERRETILRERDSYLRHAMSEVVSDPIGFRSEYEGGKVRPSHWDSP